MTRIAFRCPDTGAPLVASGEGLIRADGGVYPYVELPGEASHLIPNFLQLVSGGEGQRTSLGMYGADAAREMYRNFLDWLFATFSTDEGAWRRGMATRLRLRPGDAVLVTGCGLGDDIPPILDAIGPHGEVHAQDLSPDMVREAARIWAEERPQDATRVRFSVGDALRLPFDNGVFNAAFHFGGINLFDNIGTGISEMNRVVLPGGRVVVSDEGIAPWLRDTEYGRMVVINNPLWGRAAPIDKLPVSAADVTLTWVLGQCFWVIDFTVGSGLPAIDPHVPHKGRRGGSMWTRHAGQLEGVTEETRRRAIEAARTAGISMHDWMERALAERLERENG